MLYIYSIYSPNILDPSYWNTRPSVHDNLKTPSKQVGVDIPWHPKDSYKFFLLVKIFMNVQLWVFYGRFRDKL